jgi:predicted DNA-binding protein
MPSRKERVSFVISEEEKRTLEKLAAMDSRTVSNYLMTLIRKEIAKAEREGRLDEAS